MIRTNPKTLLAIAIALAASGCGSPADEAARCGDGERNGNETDVDCGGSCPPCVAGKACAGDADCRTASCVDGACAAPSCHDDRENGFETDVDCGGDCDARCAVGQGCERHRDCTSGRCDDGTCSAEPSCIDGVRGGDETDVDCGGAACGPCALGKGCELDRDCSSARCDGGRCIPSCDNLQVDGDESDVDCGGSCPVRCADGKRCNGPDDCVNGVCTEGGLCDAGSAGSCSDGERNGNETDIDCGGGVCPTCPNGFACESTEDCFNPNGIAEICLDGICGGREVCADARWNGRESDVDCGGPFCNRCGGGKGCREGSDCFSGDCNRGTCTAPEDTCTNGVKDGFEVDVDCGGHCPGCPDGWPCAWSTDCETNWCSMGVCGGDFLCADGEMNAKETDVDCGGGACPPCRGGKACLGGADCGSGICDGTTCAFDGPGCDDGILDGTETAVDCGGVGCSPCDDGLACLVHPDCESGFCTVEICTLPVSSLQGAPASTACSTSGIVTVASSVTLHRLVVTGGPVTLEAGTVGYYLQQDQGSWLDWAGEYAGIVLAVDDAVAVELQLEDVIDVTAELREHDCETRLYVAPPAGNVTSTGRVRPTFPSEPDAAVFAGGGGPAAEPFEGSLVVLHGLTVTEVAGHEGAEGPGTPHWWIRAGDGIHVADDFGLGEKPASGTELRMLRGLVKYRHGVYLIVPRDRSDLGLSGPGPRG